MRKNKRSRTIHNRIKNKTSIRLNNKDRTIEKWICITIALFCCLLIYKREWYLLLGTIFITVMFIWQQWRLYQECQKELSIISYTLEDILQGKTIFTEQEISDTLLSKIMAQLQRMNKINSGCQEILREEQDNIKRLLAEISHQIRTPLANMEAYLTLAEDKSITKEEYQCYLKAIKNSEEKIKFLTEKLILAARMENKIIQIHKTETDLKETVANAVFQVYKKAEEKQIFIEIKR